MDMSMHVIKSRSRLANLIKNGGLDDVEMFVVRCSNLLSNTKDRCSSSTHFLFKFIYRCSLRDSVFFRLPFLSVFSPRTYFLTFTVSSSFNYSSISSLVLFTSQFFTYELFVLFYFSFLPIGLLFLSSFNFWPTNYLLLCGFKVLCSRFLFLSIILPTTSSLFFSSFFHLRIFLSFV